MTLEDLENVTDSASDRSGSVGTDSGSGSGSDGSGSAGNDSGRDGNDSGSGGSNSGSDGSEQLSAGSDGSGNVDNSSEPANANVGNTDRNQNAVNFGSRAERIRNRRNIRLGDTARSGNPDNRSATDSAGRNEEGIGRDVNEPVIRLGAIGQGNPRKVGTTKESNKSKLSEVKALVRTFIDSIFEVPAIALKQDFWRLSTEESKQLSDAVIAWLESMPNSDQSKIAEFVGKHLPLINLAMVAFFIVSERVRTSFAIYKVTQSGKAFAQAVNSVPNPTSADVKTPMDSMFS